MDPAHFAIGLAAKPAVPRVPLWILLLASEVFDLLTFLFDAIGIEKIGVSQTDINLGVKILSPATIPWSHGFFMCIVWSLLAAAIAFLIYRERRTSAIIGLVVFSHWVLDFIVHPPELPLLFSGSPTVGLGLWSTGTGLIISVILELSMLTGGIAIYLRARKRKSVLVGE
jgi:hypothetical protein